MEVQGLQYFIFIQFSHCGLNQSFTIRIKQSINNINMTVNRLTCNSASVVLGYAYDATIQSMQSIKYSKCTASYDLIPSYESQTNPITSHLIS